MWLIQGRPTSSEIFLQSSFDSMCQSVLDQHGGQRSKKYAAEKVRSAQDAVAPGFSAIEESSGEDASSLSLVDVAIANGTGLTLRPPAIRVAAASVSAWLLTDLEVTTSSGVPSTSVAVGVEMYVEA